jgi:ribonuclease III
MDTDALSRRLDYHFQRPELLQLALTHRSRGMPNNERLEFLGDSVLNCVIATLLYQYFPRLPEGDLSRLRAYLVKEQTLSQLAQELSLGDYVLLGEGELKSGGFRRPSILADTLEAVLGGMYLDSGFSAVERVICRLYTPRLNGLDPKTMGKDPKTLLQELLQGRRIALPQYAVIATTGEAHEQQFQVECVIHELNIRTQGQGSSRRAAEQEAARQAFQLASGN